MKTLKQSTAYNLMVLMIDSTDHIAGKAGLTLTITASKNGAAFASITPTVTDRGSGWYNLALTASHTDTVGDLAVHITATGADPVDISMQVLAKSIDDLATSAALQTVDDFVDDLETRLTAARAGYLDKLNVTGTLAHSDAAATYKADVSSLATSSALSAVSAFVDTEVAAILAAVDTEVAAIKAKTDNLPALPAAVGSAMTLTAAYDKAKDDVLTPLAVVDGIADAIKAKTDNLPALPAAVGSAMTLTSGERTAIANEVEAQIINEADAERVLTAITDKIASVNPSLDDLTLAGIASAVRTELATELARIDAAISSRLSSAGYTAPDNASVSAIKVKTDNLPVSPAAVGSAMTLTAAYDRSKDDVLTPLSVVDGIVDEIKAKTTNLPSDPASNTVVNTRLSSGAYVAPANADIAAIKAKTDNLPASPADQSELEVLIAALPPAPSVNDIIAALKVAVFDGTLTFEDSIKLYNAILFGKLDGGGTGTLKFRDPADTLDRVTATVDLVTADRDHIILDLT